MAVSDYRLIAGGQTIYLHNATGAPVVGGSILTPNSTPLLIISDDWSVTPATADLVAGGDDSQLIDLAYDPVTETIPLLCRARNADDLGGILETFRAAVASIRRSPGVLYARPKGASSPILFLVDRVEIAEAQVAANHNQPGEGATDVALRLTIRRSAFGGNAALTTLGSGVSVGNTGTGSPSNLVSLGTLRGDLRSEGQPLTIRLDKPTTQSPSTLYLATLASRAYQAIASAKTTTTSTTFTASTAIDVSALRTTNGLHLHVMARLTTLTNPTKARVRVTVQTASGATLWVGPWVQLGTNTTAQLADLGGTTLDALRVPLAGTSNILLLGEIQSTDGTSVTATLASIEALLAYDFGAIDAAAALSTSQRLYLLGAQNLGSGPYLPLTPPACLITDTSDIPVRTARWRGTPPRASVGASLYLAWVDADGGHTAADTTTVTIQHAPLWRSLRGAA